MHVSPWTRASVVVASFTGLAALTGCATGPASQVHGTWDAERPAQPYAKVLVVGVSPNVKSRCRFERDLATRLAGESTEAMASCDVVDRNVPLTRELVEQAVAAQKADAVLATKLVSNEWAPKSGGSRDTRGSSGYKATDAGMAYGHYGVYGVPVVYGEFHANAESIVIVGRGQVESKLWSVNGPSQVYSLRTDVQGVETTEEGVSLVASAIAGDLVKQGLVR